MTYSIVIANGEAVNKRRVAGVKEVTIIEGIYSLFDYTGTLVFSAPADSVIYLELDQS